MAGAFAKLVGARQLVLNHIGSRFPAPQFTHRQRNTRALREGVLGEMEMQASEAWGGGRAQCAVDYFRVEVHALREAGGESEDEVMEEPATEDAGGFGGAPHPAQNNWRGHRGVDRRGRGRGGGGNRGYRARAGERGRGANGGRDDVAGAAFGPNDRTEPKRKKLDP